MTIRFPRLEPLLIALAMSSPAAADTWQIVPDVGGTEIVFHSKAPMESFDGRTRSAAGTITLDPAALDAIEISVTVDMATLDTGIGLRNGHMRENHLHTGQFPEGTFVGGTIAEGGGGTLAAGVPRAIEVDGDLTLHGVTRRVRVPLQLELGPDGSLSVRSEFPVELSDHGIPRPKFLVMKLGETQRVEITLLARPAPPATTVR